MSWKKNLFALSIAQFISMIGMTFFLPFIPLYLGELGLKSEADVSTWSGLLFSAGFLMLSMTAPIWGVLADRWGRKIMVIRAMTAAGIVLFLSSLVRTPQELLLLRLAHGAFSGFVSAAIALIAANSPEESLSFRLGLFQGTLPAGLMIGPLLGGWLHDTIGIRPTLQLGSGLLLFGAGVVLFLVREVHKPKKHSKPHTVWQNAAFVFKNQSLWPAVLVMLLANMSWMIIPPILALFVIELSQFGPELNGTITGLVFSAASIPMIIGGPVWGRLADKWGQPRVLMFCLAGTSLLFIPQGLAVGVLMLFFARFFMGFFAAGVAPSIQSFIANHAPVDRRAGVLGISFSITMMGNAIGPLLGGVLGATMGLRAPFILTAGILGISSFLATRLRISFKKPAGVPISDVG